MARELWLESGRVDCDGWMDMHWYNEGRWQELPFFLWLLVRSIGKRRRYFFWRFGTKNHFLRGRAAILSASKASNQIARETKSGGSR